MYLFIVFCKELLCVSIPFWLKDFHLCVYIFRFPPSLTLFSILSQCCINSLISQFHPISSIGAPNSVSSWSLCAHVSLQCVALQSGVTWCHVQYCDWIYDNAQWCIADVIWPEWVVDAIWSNGFDWSMVESKPDPTVGQTIQQMKRECVWDRKRDMVKREDWSFSCVLCF